MRDVGAWPEPGPALTRAARLMSAVHGTDVPSGHLRFRPAAALAGGQDRGVQVVAGRSVVAAPPGGAVAVPMVMTGAGQGSGTGRPLESRLKIR